MSRRRSAIVASSRHPGDGRARHAQARTIVALALSIVALVSMSPSARAADHWAAVAGGGADAQMMKRLEAHVRTLPGTDTRYIVGGYLELDGIAARNKQTGDEQDTFLAEYITGKGIARYFNDAVRVPGTSLGGDGRLELARGSGATLYYQRHWTPDWMTVAGASTQWASDAGARPPEALNRVVYASANLIHRLLPNLLVGAETLWGRATRVDGVNATNARVQVSLRYLVQ